MLNTIIHNVIHNEKRMDKLRSAKGDVRDKAKDYVIGEAAALKVRLTNDEAIRAAVKIVEAL